MNLRSHFVLFFFISLAITSCGKKQDSKSNQNLSQGQVTDKLLNANRAAVETENEQIEKLIARSGWNMIKTATGLRYQFIEKGKGPRTAAGKVVRFNFEVRLITNELIYSSKQTGPKEFRIGSENVESGLEEGILLLSVGDKARFVIPSYLAHGLSGDQDRIPPKATLIYTVSLIDSK